MTRRTAVELAVFLCAVAGPLRGQNPSVSVSASPTSGPTTSVTMAATSDLNGFDANSTVQLLISWDTGGVDACYLIYNIQGNALYLMDDTGSTMLGGVAPGSTPSLPLQNSQCAINVPQTTVTVNGGSVTLNAAIAFDPSFVGNPWITPIVVDTAGTHNYGVVATYQAYAANPAPPTLVSFPIPGPGFGLSLNLALQISSPNGAKYIRAVGVPIMSYMPGGRLLCDVGWRPGLTSGSNGGYLCGRRKSKCDQIRQQPDNPDKRVFPAATSLICR